METPNANGKFISILSDYGRFAAAIQGNFWKCIRILANNIFSNITDCHNMAILKNQKGESIDDQMTAAADRVCYGRNK